MTGYTAFGFTNRHLSRCGYGIVYFVLTRQSLCVCCQVRSWKCYCEVAKFSHTRTGHQETENCEIPTLWTHRGLGSGEEAGINVSMKQKESGR